ncbi:MAG: helix-turn-helix domain-containing protein [Oscillospiraceae bacterium]
MTMGEKISKLRKINMLSQEALSEKLNVSRQAISKWESDMAYPSNENLMQLGKIFSVQIGELLGDEYRVNATYGMEKQSETENDENGEGIASEKTNTGASSGIALPQNEHSPLSKSKNRWKLFGEIGIKVIAFVLIGTLLFQSVNMNIKINSLQSEVGSLRSYVYNMKNGYIINQPPEEEYIDFDYKIGEYNQDTEEIELSISLTPKTYTAATKAQFCVKGKLKSTVEDAKLENGAYNAKIKFPVEDNVSVYLYLTDGGETKSILITSFDDMSIFYKISCSAQLETHVKKAKGNIDVQGQIGIKLWGGVNPETNKKYIYPVKATIEVYLDGELYTTLPCKNLMADVNRKASGDDITENAQAEDKAIREGEVTYFEDIAMSIQKPSITQNSTLEYKVILVDNFGKEYELIPDSDTGVSIRK